MFQGGCSFFCHQTELGPCILSVLFTMTVVVPLSAFFMIISECDLNSLSALRSPERQVISWLN